MILKKGDEFFNSLGLKMIVTKYESARSVHFKFLDSGYEGVSSSSSIRRGTVRDYFHPMFFGKGFIGLGEFKTKGRHTKSYSAWTNMLERCCCPKYHKKKPTYSDVEVCDEWLNYQNFAKWFWSNYKEGMEIDKDMLSVDKKIYSPETCAFVTPFDNNSYAHQKTFTMTSPSGDRVTFTNMRKFCRDNGLSDKNLNAVHSGKRKSHKGWTK